LATAPVLKTGEAKALRGSIPRLSVTKTIFRSFKRKPSCAGSLVRERRGAESNCCLVLPDRFGGSIRELRHVMPLSEIPVETWTRLVGRTPSEKGAKRYGAQVQD